MIRFLNNENQWKMILLYANGKRDELFLKNLNYNIIVEN